MNPESIPADLSPSIFSPTSEIQSKISKLYHIRYKCITIVDLPDVAVPSDTSTVSDETVILQTDRIIRHVVEKLSDRLAKSSTPAETAEASTLLPTLINGNIQQQKELLSRLLSDYFPSKTYADATTQVTNRIILTILFYFLLDFKQLTID